MRNVVPVDKVVVRTRTIVVILHKMCRRDNRWWCMHSHMRMPKIAVSRTEVALLSHHLVRAMNFCVGVL